MSPPEVVDFTAGWRAEVHAHSPCLLVAMVPPAPVYSDVSGLAESVWTLIEQHGAKRIVVDMYQVQFLASSLMGVLVRLHKRSACSHRQLVVCGLTVSCEEAWHYCHLHEVLRTLPTRDAALSSLC